MDLWPFPVEKTNFSSVFEHFKMLLNILMAFLVLSKNEKSTKFFFNFCYSWVQTPKNQIFVETCPVNPNFWQAVNYSTSSHEERRNSTFFYCRPPSSTKKQLKFLLTWPKVARKNGVLQQHKPKNPYFCKKSQTAEDRKKITIFFPKNAKFSDPSASGFQKKCD